MSELTDSNLDDHDEGQLHFHDRWQFELKSEFSPKEKRKSEYTQELYLFIPNSLQVNSQTYPKSQFYQDEVNYVRFKTPTFSFKELLDSTNGRSPINRLLKLGEEQPTNTTMAVVEDELKLLANIIRSSLRHEVNHLCHALEETNSSDELKPIIIQIQQLIHNLDELDAKIQTIWIGFDNNWKKHNLSEFSSYIQEFISNSIHRYLSELIDQIRIHEEEGLFPVDQELCRIIIKETIRVEQFLKFSHPINSTGKDEYIIYRRGLLNKFVLDALLLKINRFAADQKLKHIIEAISAGIAMLIYLILFVWQGSVFVFNSLPFILITVALYMLKDRIKDYLKTISYTQAFKYFADYTTVIRSGNNNVWGRLKEWFSFVDPNKLSKEIARIRNKEFHSVLEEIIRQEQVIYYKKIVKIYANNPIESRRSSLNIIFRFNIHQFLYKASDPYEYMSTIDPESHKFILNKLPKVYHLNVIMKNTYKELDKELRVELKKYRIVIDKNGIKRIESIR